MLRYLVISVPGFLQECSKGRRVIRSEISVFVEVRKGVGEMGAMASSRPQDERATMAAIVAGKRSFTGVR